MSVRAFSMCVLIVFVGCTLFVGCTRGASDSDGPRTPPVRERPTLRQAPGVELSDNEERMVEALRAFYSTATNALNAPGVRDLPPDQIVSGLKAFSDPLLAHFREISRDYHALDEDRRRIVVRQYSVRNIELNRRFGEAISRWLDQFKADEKAPEFERVVRGVLKEWHEARSLWVFDVWSEDATTEIRAYALTHQERLAWMRRELDRGREHDIIILDGVRREIDVETTNCLECHASEWTERSIALKQNAADVEKLRSEIDEDEDED